MKPVQIYLSLHRCPQNEQTERLAGMAQNQLPARKRKYSPEATICAQACASGRQSPDTAPHTPPPAKKIRGQTHAEPTAAKLPDASGQLAAAARDNNLAVVRELVAEHGSWPVMARDGCALRRALRDNFLAPARAMWSCLTPAQKTEILTGNDGMLWRVVVPTASVATISKLITWAGGLHAPILAAALGHGMDAAMTALVHAPGANKGERIKVAQALWDKVDYDQWHQAANRHFIERCEAGDTQVIRFIIAHTEVDQRAEKFDLDGGMRRAARAGHLGVAREISAAVTGTKRQDLIALALDECTLGTRAAFRKVFTP